MKILFLFLALVATTGFADNPDIQACLKAWGKTPFKKHGYTYRVLRSNVKILGIGGNVEDTEATPKPQLVLIKHSVAVMSKQTYDLLNPNGWYCIKGSTTVLGKSQIRLNCKAHLASSDDGVTIAGSSEKDSGVTVLGSVRVERVGCQ